MFKKINLFILIIMIFFSGDNLKAKYEKLAYDLALKILTVAL